jgi:hypothetical protein
MRVKTKHKQRKIKENKEGYYSKSEDSIYYNPLLDEDLRKYEEEEIEKVKKMEELESESVYRKERVGGDNGKDNFGDDRSRYMFKNENVHKDKKKKDKSSVIFNMWSLICLIGNIFQIFASSISIFDTNNISNSTEILIGFGCMFAFLNIGRYIEYAESYSTIYTTIKSSLPNVGRYLLGVLPIFLGFIFFGLCIFWRSERFTSTSNVMIILFALAQGDSVFDAFKDLSGFYFFLGQFYLYLFCIMFIV